MKKLWILGTLALLPAVMPMTARADRFQERTANRIQNRLQNDFQLSGFKFNVQTVKGRLDLRGTVRTLAQRRRAFQIARRYSAGFAVRDLLVINPAVRR